jgi:nicotinate phosphoribosyltransferase
MEVTAASLPKGYAFGVLAGVEEMVEVLSGRAVDVWSAAEGSVFLPGEPVVRLSGRWCDFGELETAMLGVLCHGTGVATKAARCRVAAGERSLLSFGARRAHPALAPSIERSAYVGGCDGVSVVASAEALGIPPSGTMPHALILLAGSTETALVWFDEVIPPDVRRVALIDTFEDEKFAALAAAETLGDHLFAVRLDTPGSRRGDFHALAAEVRWELDLRGYGHVQIVVSGGLDEADILRMNDVVDGYGIGTAISDAPVVNFGMDIVEIDGQPITKRGKKSGVKQTWVCWECGARETLPDAAGPSPCPCGADRTPFLEPLLSAGEIISPLPSIHDLRTFCLGQVSDHLRLTPSADFR